jgi:hypothetical protein
MRRLASNETEETVARVGDLAHLTNRVIDQVIEAFEASQGRALRSSNVRTFRFYSG